MAVYCVTWVLINGSWVPAQTVSGGSAVLASPTTGCPSASPYMVLDNTEYLRLQTAANYAGSSGSTTINWPDIFNLSVTDGAALSVAILGVWVSAWAYRTLRRVLQPDGNSQE